MFDSLWIRALLELVQRTQLVPRADDWPSPVEVERSPESIERAAADAATAALERITLPGHFDNVRGLGFRDLAKFTKLSTRNRDLSRVRLVCVHQTAVAFGTAASRRSAWRDRIVHGKIPPDDAERYGLIANADEHDVADAARRMALHERFWGVPYHVVSLLNGDLLHNNPLAWRTYHGNAGGNDGFGWALEGLFPILARKRTGKHSPIDEFVIETGRAGLRLAVLMGRDAGAPLERVQPHRCYSGGRHGDPGEEPWREIVMPVARELHLVPDYEEKRGSGRPIPIEWDEDARFDLAGKRVA